MEKFTDLIKYVKNTVWPSVKELDAKVAKNAATSTQNATSAKSSELNAKASELSAATSATTAVTSAKSVEKNAEKTAKHSEIVTATYNEFKKNVDDIMDSGTPDATELMAGKSKRATVAEAQAGTITDKTVSPALLKAAMEQFGLFGRLKNIQNTNLPSSMITTNGMYYGYSSRQVDMPFGFNHFMVLGGDYGRWYLTFQRNNTRKMLSARCLDGDTIVRDWTPILTVNDLSTQAEATAGVSTDTILSPAMGKHMTVLRSMGLKSVGEAEGFTRDTIFLNPPMFTGSYVWFGFATTEQGSPANPHAIYQVIGGGNSQYQHQLAIDIYKNKIYTRVLSDRNLYDWSPWKKLIDTDDISTLAVGSAQRLANPVLINNVSFDGSTDISIPMPIIKPLYEYYLRGNFYGYSPISDDESVFSIRVVSTKDLSAAEMNDIRCLYTLRGTDEVQATGYFGDGLKARSVVGMKMSSTTTVNFIFEDSYNTKEPLVTVPIPYTYFKLSVKSKIKIN
ncbi:MAG: hypothetical protein LBV09_08365 [Deferribacteraceae bacterium]|jgi:hypothetical protein|nr:hypothetical protein [Deferribacteraceae bacterium]